MRYCCSNCGFKLSDGWVRPGQPCFSCHKGQLILETPQVEATFSRGKRFKYCQPNIGKSGFRLESRWRGKYWRTDILGESRLTKSLLIRNRLMTRMKGQHTFDKQTNKRLRFSNLDYLSTSDRLKGNNTMHIAVFQFENIDVTLHQTQL